jgi:O-antigen/teichoic acid export membrane protein
VALPSFQVLAERWRTQKLTRDIAYTLASFAVLAVSGIVINLVIARTRDAAALGVFNQAYAVYIIASQIATLGLHYSVLRHTALHADDAAVRGRVLGTAAVFALGLGAVAAIVVGSGAPLFAWMFDSAATGRAIAVSAAGLLLFSLNKVLLAYLNGLRLMKAFSLLQAMRYLLVMAGVTGVSVSALPIEYATLAFLLAESFTAAGALLFLGRRGYLRGFAFDRQWFGLHARFGAKGLAAGLFAEFNSRIDVLLIGVFLTDREVGIYSFAAMMVDGIYHVLAMVRLNFNPLLVTVLHAKDETQARTLLTRSRRIVLPVTMLLGLLVVLVLWVMATLLAPGKGLEAGIPSLVILAGGLTLVSAYVPFDNLLMVTGHPGFQTFQQLVTVSVNTVVAVLLLPWLGIEGAAIGTASSYLAGVGMLLFLAPRIVGWNLLTNRFKS